MTQLILKRAIPEQSRLDLFEVIPSKILPKDKDLSEVSIMLDGAPQSLVEWFEVVHDGRDRLELKGDLAQCDRVAGSMDGGEMRVVGDVGDALAESMRAGKVGIAGNAGRFAASGLRGGQVIVEGNVGAYAAAARTGARRGMSGGTLVVRGHCDRWLGARMRRGTVVVQGNVAAGCGARMIAGTIVLFAEAEQPLASGMKRGTILFAGKQPPFDCPGFNPPEKSEPAYLTILLEEVASFVPALRDSCKPQPSVLRSIGDLADRGLGELIWLGSQDVAADSSTAVAKSCS